MKLIVGLGNPGDQYLNTRHNAGFLVLEQFLKDFEPVEKTVWQKEERFKSDLALINWQRANGEIEKVILVKPLTFMNNSGMAVSLLRSFYKINPEDLWVIYDDLDLPLGVLRIRLGGAGGGHKGVESIMAKIKTDKFFRFRVGIGLAKKQTQTKEDGTPLINTKKNLGDTSGFVLGKFTKKEQKKIGETVRNASKALFVALEENIEKAQNRFNTR